MKVIAITQARFGSSRLPGKVLLEIGGKTLLQIHLERLKRSKMIDKLIVATTHEPESELICRIASSLGVGCYKGALTDVLDRFYQAAKSECPDYVVRVTSDCPLIDPDVTDAVINLAIENDAKYCCNVFPPTFPDGLDVEVFKFSELESAWNNAKNATEREHVTPYIRTKYEGDARALFNYAAPQDLSQLRFTVDEKEDLDLISHLIDELGDTKGWMAYVQYLQKNPDLIAINGKFMRNEGYLKSLVMESKIQLRTITDFTKSSQHRKAIHQLIPGGAHTYSKGDDQFPELSPAAIAYGKGSHVWDIDGNEFLDCGMGLSSVSLGHAYQPVLARVKQELEKGVNFARPSVLEREMAERFLSLVPSHDMIKFGKNGSLVTTAAVKLARAYTGRKLVAFPGDHPFYSYDDWFIGRTECSRGVPEEISALSVTFKSCDIQSLRDLFAKYPGQISCVITEPERFSCNSSCSCKGDPGQFLRDAIALAHQEGALFIIDEMVTGFKTDFPGSTKKYGLDPDMITWGKGIANGFSFCALTGKKDIMRLGGITDKGAEKVFLISTTHGGETHAMAACLATIDEFKKHDVVGYNKKIGSAVIRVALEIIKGADLSSFIEVVSCDWMPVFVFKDRDQKVSALYKTLVLQEMFKRGVQFQGTFIPSFSHSNDDVAYFAAALKESCGIYSRAIESGANQFVKGEPVKPVFRKYL